MPGATNAQALDAVAELARGLDGGAPALVFANLIETDQVYGHRKDVEGFAAALEEIDGRVGALLDGSARAGPADRVRRPRRRSGPSGDRPHARVRAAAGGDGGDGERVGGGFGGIRHDGPMADVGASVLRWLTGEQDAGASRRADRRLDRLTAAGPRCAGLAAAPGPGAPLDPRPRGARREGLASPGAGPRRRKLGRCPSCPRSRRSAASSRRSSRGAGSSGSRCSTPAGRGRSRPRRSRRR